jgi:CAAD domains of cyanobacterial aminoacyl-tRNA synthetase
MKSMTELKSAETKIDMSLEESGSLAPLAEGDESTTELKAMLSKGVEVVSNLDSILGKFFSEYKQLIISLGLVFGAIVSVKLTLALLSALNEIPLVEPILELVGLGYSAWFVTRFMLKSEKRQEFYSKFSDTKEQVLGSKK